MRLQCNKHRILVIPDLQIPFHHPDAFDFLRAVYIGEGCDTVACVGDEVDQYYLSRFDKDPDMMLSPKGEYEKAKKDLAVLFEMFPVAKACVSNHTWRVFKQAAKAGIPRGYLKNVNEFMGAPSTWTWHDHFLVGGIRFEHGDASGGMRAHRILAEANRRSTCIGHNHAYAGIDYLSNGDELIFGMNVGSLIDTRLPPFDYARKAKHKPVLSCGVVIHGVPHVIPMAVNRRGRWAK